MNENDKLNIFQTWKDVGVPPMCAPLIENMRELNKNCNHFLLTDENIVLFIKTTFPEYYDFFTKFKYKIQQIDFFRYLLIYHYGGVYLDLDMEMKTPFDDLDKTKCIFPMEYKTSNGFTLGNYAFYSPKNHPFLKHIIDTILNSEMDFHNVINENKDEIEDSVDDKEFIYVYHTTGPSIIQKCYMTYENKKEIILLEPSYIFEEGCFGHYGKHNEFGFWKNKNNTNISNILH
jgi:mannosyltransferase OCH1-like enzyme